MRLLSESRAPVAAKIQHLSAAPNRPDATPESDSGNPHHHAKIHTGDEEEDGGEEGERDGDDANHTMTPEEYRSPNRCVRWIASLEVCSPHRWRVCRNRRRVARFIGR